MAISLQSRVSGAVEILGQKDDFILENEQFSLVIFIESLNMNIYLYIMNGKLGKKVKHL